jgi:hypothetical protein
MRKIVTATCLTSALLLSGFVSSGAIADASNRPGGAITAPEAPTPANGGDQGWGNCGHNSSGGNPHSGDNGRGGGNGGDTKADCAVIPTDPFPT